MCIFYIMYRWKYHINEIYCHIKSNHLHLLYLDFYFETLKTKENHFIINIPNQLKSTIN